jgi:glycine cleavage system aminomethyltransferase T
VTAPTPHRPLRRSALHHCVVAVGARMEVFRGWERAQAIGDPAMEANALNTGVALADLSAQHMLLVQAHDLDAWLPFAPEVGRVALTANGGSPTRCCRLTAESALFLSTDPVQLPPAPAGCGHRTDLTAGRTVIAVAGPLSRDLLRAATQVDLREHAMPDLRCVESSLARVPAMILRFDRQKTLAYEILVPRDFGEYVWEALLDAGAPLGVRAVGAAALEPRD